MRTDIRSDTVPPETLPHHSYHTANRPRTRQNQDRKYLPLPPVNRKTDTSENIIFRRTTYVVDNGCEL